MSAESCFVNFSNHPISRWPAEQVASAEALRHGAPRDYPGGFPGVDPEADEAVIARLADEHAEGVLALEPGGVFVAGEFSLAFAVVGRLRQAGVPCYYATSRRVVRDEVTADGVSRRVSEFRFVRWRLYE